jgi:hypothetical protein
MCLSQELEALQAAIESRLDPMEKASEKGSSVAGDDAGEGAAQVCQRHDRQPESSG